MSFFKRWKKGMKDYADSPIGDVSLKIVFMKVVVIGLFGGGVQRLLQHDYWMFLVLVGFGFVTLLDLNKLVKLKKSYDKSLEGL